MGDTISPDLQLTGFEPSPEPSVRPERPRCLLVEDNPVNRLLVGVLLDRIGLDHVAVGCTEEAVLRLRREAFDAVLLDVAMDGMAGLAAAQKISATAGEDGPLVLALGTGGLDGDILEAAGFAGVVENPVDADQLVSALVGALERRLMDLASA